MIDAQIATWTARYGVQFLRISLGIVYCWFGVLKFFPGFSPAEGLARETIGILSFGFIPAQASLLILAVWECLIGLGFIFGICLRVNIYLMWLHMLGTFTPLIIYPQAAYTHFPYALTLAGQYIIKNLVLIGASMVIYAAIGGGGLSPLKKV